MEEAKNKGGRPSKMKDFIGAFSDVIEKNEFDVVILTDEELLIECNERLEEENQIAERTFQSWKAGEVKSEEYNQFLRLYKKALLNQRRQLFIKLESEPTQWQKYAWIIERKFSEWNLKKISEVDQKTEHTVLGVKSINISVGNE